MDYEILSNRTTFPSRFYDKNVSLNIFFTADVPIVIKVLSVFWPIIKSHYSYLSGYLVVVGSDIWNLK